MPVSVQLPGYQRGGAEGLASVLGAAGNIYHQIKQGQLTDTENQQKQAAFKTQQDLLAQNQNPDSPLSQLKKQAAVSAIPELAAASKSPETKAGLAQLQGWIQNGVENPMPDGQMGPGTQHKLSGQEIDQVVQQPLFEGLKPVMAKMQADAMADKLSGLVNTKNNQLADQIAEHFTKNPSIQKWQKQKDQAQIDLHTLQSGAEITPQIKAEIEKGIANFMSGGGSAGLGATEKMEFNNLYTVIAKGKSFWSSEQQKADPPGYRQYLTDTLERLDKGADLNMWTAAQRIASQKQGIYKGNPQADQSLRQSLETYRPTWTGQHGQSAAPGGTQDGGHAQTDVAAELRKRGLLK